ncbi:type II secretion system F family protein [Microbacterium caowuchunii]|uniref:type II secretion system F family protein n=1 Tax=Microbacterium caowuchunii TaxID=2614638 RepID=UPI001CD43206|nr:pilus assembly protein TadB [Microbacterium caowuchunii]
MAGLIPRRRAHADRTPEVALRLAVLLQAGVAPAPAWRFLADSGERDAAEILHVHAAGADLGAAIGSQGVRWQAVGAAWQVATSVGAPLADALRSVASALRDADDCRDEVRVALAEPASTARLMSWLPLVAVLLGLALGFDTLGVLTGTPGGVACLVVGVVLTVLARRWNARLVRSAGPPPGVPGLRAELTAIALSGGVSLERARRLAADALGTADDRPVRAVAVPDTSEEADLERILGLSRDAGVPAAELLRAAAAIARHRARTDGRMRAARLAASLLLPLGVCVLPAFIVLGVAPMLISILSSTSLGL